MQAHQLQSREQLIINQDSPNYNSTRDPVRNAVLHGRSRGECGVRPRWAALRAEDTLYPAADDQLLNLVSPAPHERARRIVQEHVHDRVGLAARQTHHEAGARMPRQQAVAAKPGGHDTLRPAHVVWH